MPSGLQKTSTHLNVYEDTNIDGVTDKVTETHTTNQKATAVVTDVLAGTVAGTSPEGRTLTAAYDTALLVPTRLSIPGLLDTTFEYDLNGRLRFETTGTRRVEYRYNANGFMDTMIDAENKSYTFEHDPLGRVTVMHRPDLTDLYFSYDANGNLAVLTNPVPADHTFNYNRVNAQSAYLTPLSGSYSYQYDSDRRPTLTTFPSGRTIQYVYTPGLDQIDYIQTPEGRIDMTYLCGSRPGTISKGLESLAYAYDGSLLTSETYSGSLNQALVLQYNSDFNVEGFTYAGQTEAITYDNDGLMAGSGGFTITRNMSNGLPETVSDLTFSLNRTFSGYGEADTQNITVNGQPVYTNDITVRDNAGRIVQRTETVNGVASNYNYAYDNVGRLLTVTLDGTLVEEYRYDANGTRNYEMNSRKGIAGRLYDYTAEDHLLLAGNVSYQHDVDGFLTTKTDGSAITSFSYSSRGELLSATLPDGRLIEYVHDPLGRRIAKNINGVTTEKYLWGGLTHLLAVYDGNDNLIQRFQYADDRVPFSMTTGGMTYYLTWDHVGSLRQIVDSAGNVVKRVDYDTFGHILTDSAPTFAVPFGFAGGLHDRDTGLVRFGFRDYDPDTGRWTAKDPIFFYGGDTDLYGYVQSDPVNFVDEFGLKRGGILIPIRNWIKKHAGPEDIIGPIIEEISGIPLNPYFAFLYILTGTREAGRGSTLYLPPPPDPNIPLDWSPNNTKYWTWNLPEDDGVIQQGPCE